MSHATTSLMYHNVTTDQDSFENLSPSVRRYFVTQAVFEKQIQTINETFRLIRLKNIRSLLFQQSSVETKTETNDKRGVHLTFDDGWAGTIDVAGEILEKYNFEATLFVTTDFIGRKNFLTEQQLAALPNETFQIGAHGKTHRLFQELSDKELREELRIPKEKLEDVCGCEIDTLACPGGSMDHRVQEIAHELGYRMIFTSRVNQIKKGTPTSDIPRVAVTEETSTEQFQKYLQGKLSREIWRSRALGLPKRLLGRKLYRRLRAILLGEKNNQKEMTDLS